MATLKSNNIRLTSALQESTANVDEWKRQLHTYKEENLRLKRDIDAVKPNAATSGGGATEINEEMRRETILLKSRIQSLEKEMLSTEIELKAANKSLKEKSNDQSVSFRLSLLKDCFCYIFSLKQMKQMNDISIEYAKHLSDMCNLQKEMEKLLHKST